MVNIGIKQPISNILDAAKKHNADAIGMSGLLVKSTVIMKENLQEMNAVKASHFPVILGGAALTRAYVEDDLTEVYDGNVYYAKDAFESLRLMQEFMASIREKDSILILPMPLRQHKRKQSVRLEKNALRK